MAERAAWACAKALPLMSCRAFAENGSVKASCMPSGCGTPRVFGRPSGRWRRSAACTAVGRGKERALNWRAVEARVFRTMGPLRVSLCRLSSGIGFCFRPESWEKVAEQRNRQGEFDGSFGCPGTDNAQFEQVHENTICRSRGQSHHAFESCPVH